MSGEGTGFGPPEPGSAPLPPPSAPPISPPPAPGPPTVPYGAARPEPENRNRAVIIGAVVALLAVAGVVVFFLTRDDDDDGASSPGSAATAATAPDDTTGEGDDIPPPTEEPIGLGDDAALDELAQDCYDGEMPACDDLFDDADEGSEYRRYGDTCAGRQEEGTRVFCVTAFPSD